MKNFHVVWRLRGCHPERRPERDRAYKPAASGSAIHQLAALSSTTGDFAKAIELYRQSLNLEDVNEVRAELAIVYLPQQARQRARRS